MQYAVCSMQYAVSSMQYAEYSMQYAVYSMQYTVCGMRAGNATLDNIDNIAALGSAAPNSFVNIWIYSKGGSALGSATLNSQVVYIRLFLFRSKGGRGLDQAVQHQVQMKQLDVTCLRQRST